MGKNMDIMQEIENDEETRSLLEKLLNRDYYDSSLLDSLGLLEDICGRRILDIGAGCLNSSFDLALGGASQVVAVEPYPFRIHDTGSRSYPEMIRSIAKYLATKRGLEDLPQNLKLFARSLGGYIPKHLGKFERAFFFFPPVPLVGNYPEYDVLEIEEEFEGLVQSVCYVLTPEGKLSIVTEVPSDKIRGVEVLGFERSVREYTGRALYSERQRLTNWKEREDPEPIRPASSLALTVVEYSPVSIVL